MDYDAAVRCASTQSVIYQSLIKLRKVQTLYKNRMGKISETDPSALRPTITQLVNFSEIELSAW